METGVGFGVGFGVGAGVGLGVGLGVAAGRGVAAGVGRGVGVGVGRACAPVGAGVVAAVARGELPGTAGDGMTAGFDGDDPGSWLAGTSGEPDGRGERDGPGDPLGGGSDAPADGDGLDPGPRPVGVGTTAMPSLGLGGVFPRCWSSMPPIPNAIVARTRFRTPRLNTSRAR
ncbi:MAG: hypothetical protein ACTS8Z_01255 [Candidatus Limnocylindrales bacterium]